MILGQTYLNKLKIKNKKLLVNTYMKSTILKWHKINQKFYAAA